MTRVCLNRRYCNGSGLIAIYNAMIIRPLLIAASALALPAAALAQYQPVPPAAPMQMPAPRAEPWMAAPPGPAPEPWGVRHGRGGRTGGTRGALESVDLPPAIEQGVDMIYIDEDLVPKAVQDPAL